MSFDLRLNGKFKIDVIGNGSNKVAHEKTNRSMYGIVVGKNNNLKIDYITANLIYEKSYFTTNVFGEKVFVNMKNI